MSRDDRGPSGLPSRREFIALGAGAFVVSMLPWWPWTRRRLLRRCLPVMGTLAEVAVDHDDPRVARHALDLAFARLQAVDRGMTRFDPRSDVGRANRRAAAEPVPVSPETAGVIERALAWARASDGAFDPCLGRVTELWDVGRRHEPPPEGEVRRFAARRLHDALEVSWRGGDPRVRFHDPDVAIDLGGIAKGHGIDRAVEALRECGIRSGLVNVGGDLFALGTSEDGDPWRVGVRSPADPGRLSGTLDVTDAAVATSGDYEQFFMHAGRRYHHLLDPASAEPWRAEAHSLTVVADTCITADAAATAVFGMEPVRARSLLSRCAPGARIA